MDHFHDCFAELPDPRADNSRHELVEILFIALLASLCGAKNCSDMAEFGVAKEPLLRDILTLAHGIPSHDTFSRIFRVLDPEAFDAAFRRFMTAFAGGAGLLWWRRQRALKAKPFASSPLTRSNTHASQHPLQRARAGCGRGACSGTSQEPV